MSGSSAGMTTVEMVWVGIGFLGQAAFTSRFLVQWLASERKRESVIPVSFWWISLIGGAIMLAYAIHRGDPVFTVGQASGLVVYGRNLMLVNRRGETAEDRARRIGREGSGSTVAGGRRPHLAGRGNRGVAG